MTDVGQSDHYTNTFMEQSNLGYGQAPIYITPHLFTGGRTKHPQICSLALYVNITNVLVRVICDYILLVDLL